MSAHIYIYIAIAVCCADSSTQAEQKKLIENPYEGKKLTHRKL